MRVMGIKWRLHEVMAERRMTNIELGNRIGISPSNVSKLRTQTRMPRINSDRLESLCKALNCTPGDLLVLIDE